MLYSQVNSSQSLDTIHLTNRSEKSLEVSASSSIPKQATWFSQIDFSIMGIDTKISYFNIYSSLGINFYIAKSLYLGSNFSYKVASTTDYQVIQVDNKQIDVNSFNEWGAGLNFGGVLFKKSRMICSPELQINYFQYKMEDVAYSVNQELYIKSSYIGFTPQLYIGSKISDFCSIGIKGGYRLALYLQGEKNDVYNPQSYNVGLFFRFSLSNY